MKSLRLFPVFCLLLVACEVAGWSDALAQPGQVLLSDDFSNSASGWPRQTAEEGTTDYFAGAYRMIVRRANYNLWALASGHDYADVHLEVDAGPLSGPIENRFGLLCRYRDEQHFYFFVISADGYYGLGKVHEEGISLLDQEMMTFHPAIRSGFASNHLRLDCVGDTLAAYVNGRPVALARDSELTTGRVGLLAGAFEEADVDVVFDNFQIIKP